MEVSIKYAYIEGLEEEEEKIDRKDEYKEEEAWYGINDEILH